MLRSTVAFFLLLLVVFPAQSQTTYEFNQENSEISVDGTSNNTPHWTVYATEFSGSVTLGDAAESGLSSVESIMLTVPTRMLKSRKSGMMDRVMYGAIKTDEHSEVTFNLTEVTDLEVSSDAAATMVVHGDLTLAGTTNAVSIPVELTSAEGGMWTITGSHVITMTDYGLQPATAMFGAMRTGKDVTVNAKFQIGPVE